MLLSSNPWCAKPRNHFIKKIKKTNKNITYCKTGMPTTKIEMS